MGKRKFISVAQRVQHASEIGFAPEAQQARSHLNGMGVRINPTKPSAYR